MQPRLDAASRDPPRPTATIQFYSVELMPLAAGGFSVGMNATVCESTDDDRFDLVGMPLASARVSTIDDALAVIRDAIASTALGQS